MGARTEPSLPTARRERAATSMRARGTEGPQPRTARWRRAVRSWTAPTISKGETASKHRPKPVAAPSIHSPIVRRAACPAARHGHTFVQRLHVQLCVQLESSGLQRRHRAGRGWLRVHGHGMLRDGLSGDPQRRRPERRELLRLQFEGEHDTSTGDERVHGNWGERMRRQKHELRWNPRLRGNPDQRGLRNDCRCLLLLDLFGSERRPGARWWGRRLQHLLLVGIGVGLRQDPTVDAA